MRTPIRLLSLVLFVVCSSGSAHAADEWKNASWVWNAQDDQSETPRLLRHTFELAGKPKAARALVAVDDRHVCYVNGKKVGERPSWNEAGRYDITPHLREGKNVIAVEAVNGGGPGAAIAWVEVTGEDGKTVTFGSGKDWRISRKLESDGDAWRAADFDDSKWPRAAVLGPAGMAPYNLLGQPAAGNDPAQPLVQQYQPAEKQLPNFVVPDGFKIELVAAEPLLINPVSLALDEKGRMFVGESHTYRYGPDGSPVKPYSNPIVMLDPLPDGSGYKRVVVAEGFDDPCMGLLVKDGKLWATSNQYLYLFDLGSDGRATNKRLLLEDKNKAWNPFGFFMIEWGPDGLLYMSVGDHEIKIDGPTNKGFGARGRSGMVCRMKPDGSDLELLTQGFRVPYAFEFDPFGQLWLLSNGEGNPNRYAKIIDGADYFMFTRDAADHDWARGAHLLAPPVIERPRGAATALTHYYGAAFPASMQGDQFLINWGPHGFGNVNHTLDRYVPDASGNVEGEPEQWLGCSDPHFRPTTVLLDHDGTLLIADWYGRDDESDVTGRIWRVRYTGSEAPAAARPPQTNLTGIDPELSSLGSASHLARGAAIEALAKRGNTVVEQLRGVASTARQPLGAASALWALLRIGTPQAAQAIESGLEHEDWRVRRLAVQLMRRSGNAGGALYARAGQDSHPAVRVAWAVSHDSKAAKPQAAREALMSVITAKDVAADRHLRYEAALHLAKVADAPTFTKLLGSDNADVRLAGLIAVDVALYESVYKNAETGPAAAAALAAAMADPGPTDVGLLIEVAGMHRGSPLLAADGALAKALPKLLARPGLEPAALTRGVLLARSLSASADVGEATKAALEALARGQVPLRTADDHLAVLDLLAAGGGPPDFAVRMVEQCLRGGDDRVRAAANDLALRLAKDEPRVKEILWRYLNDTSAAWFERAEMAATAALIETQPNEAAWEAQLAGVPDTWLIRDLVRSWRRFRGNDRLTRALVAAAPQLMIRDPGLKEDMAFTLHTLGVPPAELARLDLPAVDPAAEADAANDAKLAEEVLKHPAGGGENLRLGRQVFVRAGCVQCHTAGTDTRLGPPLAGIGATQTREYLLESILEPSKVIKTGFETELLQAGGKTYSGLVREDGDHLRIISGATQEDRIPLNKVTRRKVQKLSIMPEELEKSMSRPELADLLSYLQSLKTPPAAAAAAK